MDMNNIFLKVLEQAYKNKATKEANKEDQELEKDETIIATEKK